MQKAQKVQKVLLDILERTAAAYVTTFLGLLLADGFDLTDVSALKAAAIAALPAALSVIKGAIGTRFGDRSSAAWLPGGGRSRKPRKTAAKAPGTKKAARTAKVASTAEAAKTVEAAKTAEATDGSTGTTGG